MSSQKKVWKRKKAAVRKGDTLVIDGKPTDLVIAVMGPTDVGKSTFVDVLFGAGTTIDGHKLKSCTSNLKHVIRPLPSDPTKRLVVVDTPGFDDAYVDDAEILRRISDWLATSYASDMKLAGVIYLHDISQTRMLGTTRKNLDLFRRICGDNALRSVVLGTTKWSEVSREVGEARLQQLKTYHWAAMIENGSCVFNFENTNASAWSMVNYLLEKHVNNLSYDVLQLQEELVDFRMIIPDTSAGKELRYTLEQLLKSQRDKVTDEQLQKTLTAIQALKVSIPVRLMQFFGLGSSFAQQNTTAFIRQHTSVRTETQTSKTINESSHFKGSRNFDINGAIMNDGAISTITYNHTHQNDTHFHFHKQPDAESMNLILKAIERGNLNMGVESTNDGVHIHCQQVKSVTSNSEK